MKKSIIFRMSRGDWSTMMYALQFYMEHCQESIKTDPDGAAGWAMGAAEGKWIRDKLTALGKEQGWVK